MLVGLFSQSTLGVIESNITVLIGYKKRCIVLIIYREKRYIV